MLVFNNRLTYILFDMKFKIRITVKHFERHRDLTQFNWRVMTFKDSWKPG